MLQPTEKIWHNGRLIPWNDAKIHVLSHVVSYGSSVFEGIRCYETERGPALFRARDHARRLIDSAKIYRMEVPYSVDELTAAFVDTVRENKLARLLHPSDRSPRLWRRGRAAEKQSDRNLHRLLSVGQVSRRRRPRQRRRRLRLFLEPHRAEHFAGAWRKPARTT